MSTAAQPETGTPATSKLTVKQAIAKLRETFPFPRYAAASEEAAAEIAATIARRVPPGSRVLDFGCGPMYKTAVLQLIGYQCAATDDMQDPCFTPENLQTMSQFAQSLGIDFFAAGAPAPRREFDLIAILDVIEHLHDSPRELLVSLAEQLRPEGYLLITVPNGGNIRKRLDLLRGRTNFPRFASFYWLPGPWRGHVREYVRGDLQSLARFLQFKLVELRSYHHMIDVLPRPLRPWYRAVTSLFPGWRDSWLLLLQKPKGWEPPRSVPPELRAEVAAEADSLNSWQLGCRGDGKP